MRDMTKPSKPKPQKYITYNAAFVAEMERKEREKPKPGNVRQLVNTGPRRDGRPWPKFRPQPELEEQKPKVLDGEAMRLLLIKQVQSDLAELRRRYRTLKIVVEAIAEAEKRIADHYRLASALGL